MNADKEDSTLERAAIFIMSLTPDQASKVLTHMSPQQIQRLGTAMAGLKTVEPQTLNQVRSALISSASKQSSLPLDKDAHIRAVFSEALGAEKAGGLMGQILSDNESKGIEALHWMDVPSIVDLLKQEHPQIQTIVLSSLHPEKAAKVLSFFDKETQLELMLRIAAQAEINSGAMKELNVVLEKQLKNSVQSPAKKTINGMKKAADLINALDGPTEARLVAQLQEKNKELFEKLQDLMLIFEHLLKLTDKDMQLLLREVASDKLVIALKGADPALRDKIFANMSKRAAELLKEDLENKGPVKLKVVEEAQKEILVIARRMSEAGQIVLNQKEEGDMV